MEQEIQRDSCEIYLTQAEQDYNNFLMQLAELEEQQWEMR